MSLIIALTTLLLLWSTALKPMLDAADVREDIEFEQLYRRFQLRSIKKYHGVFSADQRLQALPLEEIEKHFHVQNFYDDIGR